MGILTQRLAVERRELLTDPTLVLALLALSFGLTTPQSLGLEDYILGTCKLSIHMQSHDTA